MRDIRPATQATVDQLAASWRDVFDAYGHVPDRKTVAVIVSTFERQFETKDVPMWVLWACAGLAQMIRE